MSIVTLWCQQSHQCFVNHFVVSVYLVSREVHFRCGLRGSHKLEQGRGGRWQLVVRLQLSFIFFFIMLQLVFFFSVTLPLCQYFPPFTAFFFTTLLLLSQPFELFWCQATSSALYMRWHPDANQLKHNMNWCWLHWQKWHWEHHLWFHRDTGVRASASSLKWCFFLGKQMRAGYNYKRDLNQIRLKWHGLVNTADKELLTPPTVVHQQQEEEGEIMRAQPHLFWSFLPTDPYHSASCYEPWAKSQM